jgi:hypothetical protein
LAKAAFEKQPFAACLRRIGARDGRRAQPRGLRSLRRHDKNARITLPEFKMLVREQFFMLLLDQEAALAAIPKLLPENANERRAAFAAIREVLSAGAELSGEVARRLNRIAELFSVDAGTASNIAPFDPNAKAS